VQNIRANNLQHVIFPYRLAVTGIAGEQVRFPVAPSAYNAILTDEPEAGDGASEWVKTTDLRHIVEPIQRIDLLKVDCEGAEYDVFSPAAEDALRKVRAIRMEYHLGRARELIVFLERCGFRLTLARSDRSDSGSLWFDRET
jgi:FkbM family methyltransferase